MPRGYLVSLAKSGIILLPGAGATSAYTAGISNASSTDAYTFPVTGGNGEVSNFFGIVDLGGSLVYINSSHSQTAAVTSLRLNFFTGALTGIINGAAHSVTIAYVGGNLSTSTGSGTETFSATQLSFGGKAASALNTALATKAFVKAVNLGALSTTFDVTIS